MKRGFGLKHLLSLAQVLVFAWLMIAAIATIQLHANPITAQQSKDKQKKPAEPPPQGRQGQQKDQPAPLFQGKSNLKSSRQTKDTATAGFNGIGPNGEVDKKLLESSADGDDSSKADQLANLHFKRSEVDAFVSQGGLKPRGK